jgi:hypothetical protein
MLLASVAVVALLRLGCSLACGINSTRGKQRRGFELTQAQAVLLWLHAGTLLQQLKPLQALLNMPTDI